MDTREGLQEHFTLHWKHYICTRILDYEGVTFHYRNFDKVWHLYKECPLVNHTNVSKHLSKVPKTVPGEPKHLATTGRELNKATKVREKKSDTSHTQTPSPPMTRAWAAAIVALSSSNYIIFSFFNSLTSTASVLYTSTSHFIYTFVRNPPSLSFPLYPSHLTFSYTPPSFPNQSSSGNPSTSSHFSNQSHSYNI